MASEAVPQIPYMPCQVLIQPTSNEARKPKTQNPATQRNTVAEITRNRHFITILLSVFLSFRVYEKVKVVLPFQRRSA